MSRRSNKLGSGKIRKMSVRELRIHPEAQREIVSANLRRVKRNLDRDAIGIIYAVEYPIGGVDAVWGIDGQHRLRALRALELEDLQVTVYIHTDVQDDARSCELFLKYNERSAVSAFDRFQASVTAGWPGSRAMR